MRLSLKALFQITFSACFSFGLTAHCFLNPASHIRNSGFENLQTSQNMFPDVRYLHTGFNLPKILVGFLQKYPVCGGLDPR
jgi:hypothetical protein